MRLTSVIFFVSAGVVSAGVHLASAGFPIVGDILYGGAPSALDAGRFWLHLSEMEFESPASGAVKVSAPLSADLSRLLSPRN